MLFWIILAITAAFVIWGLVDDWFDKGQFIGAGVFGSISVTMLLVIMTSHAVVDGEVAKYEQRREALVYQYENDMYDNDNDLGKKELMDDIQKWNETLASNRENQDNFWIGIFYPNIYDQFEFIELK